VANGGRRTSSRNQRHRQSSRSNPRNGHRTAPWKFRSEDPSGARSRCPAS